MGSLDTKKTMVAVMCGAMWLAACGGGEGTPRPDNAAGTGATGGSGAGAGGTGGSAAGSGGMMPVDDCPMRTPRVGGLVNALDEVGMEATDTEHRRFPTGDGGWFIFHASPADGQCGDTCTTTPPRNDNGPFALSPTMPARTGSANALHFVGTGFPSTAYGAGVGFYLDCASLGDAVTGVSFYYRSDIPVTFGIAMGLTGASVDHTSTLPASPDEWAHAEIALSSLSPAITDRSVFGTMFWRLGVPAGTMADWTFDFWLDDVSFTP